MWIQFLGTGDAFCSGGRFQTCFLVKVPDFCFLIDCGATSLLALKSRKIDTNLIDGAIITHFHGDHIGGLPYVLLDAHINSKRTRPFSIAGPPGISTRVGEMMDMLYPKVNVLKLSYPLEFVEFDNSQKIAFGPLKLESFQVVHVPESLPHGIRIIAKDTVLSFSGDTGWTDSLYQIAHEADLFICECNFFQTEADTHLNYRTLKQELEKLKCKRIILNHLGPEMLENLSQCDHECSEDGMIIEI